jgi:hypothetical protein
LLGAMCVPTVLSLANTAAQLGLASALANICARATFALLKMDQPPYTRAMYVFDILRIGVPKNQK